MPPLADHPDSQPTNRVVTLTMNPALDVATAVDQVIPAHKLRCEAASTHPGGGGINVARVIHRLGGNCLAVFPSGGTTGHAISSRLAAEGVPLHTVNIEQESRESLSVHEHQTGREYRFVLPGPELQQMQWQACLDLVKGISPPPRYLVASGSLPQGVPEDFYAMLAKICHRHGSLMVLDTSGAALKAGLAAGVYLFKPSLRELQELTGKDLSTDTQRVAAARNLIQQGQTQIVALSLGEDGAMLITATQAWRSPALPVPIASTIGAGDSFLGGLIWALDQGQPFEQAFSYGMAAASAALLYKGTALCDPQDVHRLQSQVRITLC